MGSKIVKKKAKKVQKCVRCLKQQPAFCCGCTGEMLSRAERQKFVELLMKMNIKRVR